MRIANRRTGIQTSLSDFGNSLPMIWRKNKTSPRNIPTSLIGYEKN